jgi:hypothetical protein
MRKTNEARDEGERAEVEVSGISHRVVELGVPGPSVLVADATARSRRPVEDGPPVKRYRIVRGGTVRDAKTGTRVTIHEGKEIDSLNYDVRDLQKQGIRVAKIDPNENAFEPVE